MSFYTPSARTGKTPAYEEYNRIYRGFEEVDTITGGPGWEDYLLANLDLGKSADSPTFKTFKDNIKSYAFPNNAVKEGLGDLHIMHNVNLSSVTVYPHVHWSTDEATPTGACQWKFDYMYSRGHRQEAFGTQLTVAAPAYTPIVQYEHCISEVSAGIDLTNMEPDMLILLRVYRDTDDVADTLVGDAFLFRVDFHVMIDGIATNEKAAPFTKV